MTQEDIITIAIREAFKCGVEEGELSNSMLNSLQREIEDLKQGKNEDLHKDDGVFAAFQKEVAGYNEATLEENHRLREYNKKLFKENSEIGKVLEEKDATITDLRNEVERLTAILCDSEIYAGKKPE